MENKNPYLEKFKSKSSYELEQIVQNKERYTKLALKAAKELLQLNLKDSNGIENTAFQKKITYEAIPELDYFDLAKFFRDSLDPKPFLRTFDLQVFLSLLALGLLLLLTTELSGIYFDDYLVFDILREGKTLFFGLIMLVNHLIYKKEKKLSNNFTGRMVSDFMLLFTFYGLWILFQSFKVNEGESEYSEPLWRFLLTILIFSGVLFFETAVGFLKNVLQKFKFDLI